MTSCHLVNVWTDAEPGQGGFVPMADSLLWLPEDFRPGHAAPAFVYIHGWGAYPYAQTATSLGPQFAAAGIVFLSLCLRRRGMEGQLNAMPDDDLRDIKLAVDYLHTNGCRKVFLLGEEMGGHSALRYLARHGDRRVAGLAWAEPVDDPADWLRAAVGDDAYESALQTAGVAVRQGAGMDYRVDLLPAAKPHVTQFAPAFLSWWSPSAAMRNGRHLEDLAVPLLTLSASAVAQPDARATESHTGAPAGWFRVLADWAARHGAEQALPVAPEPVQVDGDGGPLRGLLWRPAGGNADTAVLLVHGLTSTPLSPMFRQMAPVLAQENVAALAVEIRRSGWAGHETATLDNDADDLAAWVAWLVAAGYTQVVLAGASIGSISVGRYYSLRQPSAVVAIAHLMPTADCPDWFRLAAGEGPYAAATAQARAAVAAGRGDHVLIDIDVRQPPPSLFGSRFRWTQRAAAWLSWWGPDADSRNIDHIARADVPLLLLSGTDDSYNDEARFAELSAAAVNAPAVEEIWYPGIDHGLAGVERQVARDLVDWLARAGVR